MEQLSVAERPEIATDLEIARLGGGQHGIVAREQLLALGTSEAAIKHRLRSGRLHRLHQGVYAVGHTALTQQSRWLAAVLACGPQAVLSHRTAAQHLRLLSPRVGWIDVTTTSSEDAPAEASTTITHPSSPP